MAQAEWRVELALFSDSFRSTVTGLVEELGDAVSASKPGGDQHAWNAVVTLNEVRDHPRYGPLRYAQGDTVRVGRRRRAITTPYTSTLTAITTDANASCTPRVSPAG